MFSFYSPPDILMLCFTLCSPMLLFPFQDLFVAFFHIFFRALCGRMIILRSFPAFRQAAHRCDLFFIIVRVFISLAVLKLLHQPRRSIHIKRGALSDASLFLLDSCANCVTTGIPSPLLLRGLMPVFKLLYDYQRATFPKLPPRSRDAVANPKALNTRLIVGIVML